MLKYIKGRRLVFGKSAFPPPTIKDELVQKTLYDIWAGFLCLHGGLPAGWQPNVSVQFAKNLAKHFGASNDTVYKWIDKQGMPAHRMGRLWKFKISQVDAWIESGGAAEPTKTNPGGNK